MNKTWLWGMVAGIVVTLSSLVYFGCAGVPKNPIINPSPTIGTIQSGLTNDVAGLTTTTDTITSNATKGQTATPPSAQVTLQPFWVNILVSAGVQGNIIKDLQTQIASATTAKTQADALVADDAKLKTQYAALQSQNASAFHTISIIGFGIGLLAIAGGIALVFSGFLGGKIIGVAGAALSVTCLVFALITNALNQINVYVIFGTLVVCVGGVVWYLFKHKALVTAVTNTKVKLQSQFDSLQTENTSVKNRLENAIATTESLSEVNSKLVVSHNQANSKLASLQGEKEKLTTDMGSKLTLLDKKLLAIENKQFSAKIAAVEAKTAKLETRIEAVNIIAQSAEKVSSQTKSFLDGVTYGMNYKDMWTMKSV